MKVSERGEQLIALFAKTLGDDAAKDLVRATALSLDVSLQTLDVTQAIHILEKISHTDGLVGITARFAKVRFILPSNR
ncbi:MAG: hypothetical protein GY822_18215 [Deltaproteobacteria bacterium]|nr:hypothetical protein [Deltaproteobacteria bacterium]